MEGLNRKIPSLSVSFESSLQLSREILVVLQGGGDGVLDFTGSRGMRDTGSLGRYLYTRIGSTGGLIDVGLLVGKFKGERRIKSVIQVSGSGNC